MSGQEGTTGLALVLPPGPVSLRAQRQSAGPTVARLAPRLQTHALDENLFLDRLSAAP